MRKKLYILLALCIITTSVFAQVPEKMSYQAVVRDAANALVTNQEIGMQISILQGATAVYTETQTPISNTNGLVSLKIGEGTIISGDFTAIDWSVTGASYFIKTETDPTGGTDYTISGTSQLLSVPFGLYAKTSSDSLAIALNTAKIGITSEQATVITNLAITIERLNAEIEALEKESEPASIGDLRAGGVVFWVDPLDNTNGLVCALEDQSAGGGIQWYNGSYVTTGATGTAIGTGAANTTAIISLQGATATDYAAGLARAYAGGGYTDWFLPGKDELNEMYDNKATLEAVAEFSQFNNEYWSSTEYDVSNAWLQNFSSGFQAYNFKDYPANVRAVRAF